VRTVSGFAKLVLEDYADKLDIHGKDYLTRIQNGSDRIIGLIEALLRLSRISSQPIEPMDYDLSRMATKIVSGFREAEPERMAEVVIAEGLHTTVDLNLIRAALTNLLENAWKFTSKTANARIEFGVTVNNGKTVYYVKDNGAGFNPDYAEKMFKSFHRLHTDEEFEGMGIGLTIVKRIIRRHGGTIWAEGEVGKGATFSFTVGEIQ